MKKFIYFPILIFSLAATAQLKENGEEFLIDSWSEGLHIFVGAGVNLSSYRSDSRRNYLGLGSNFKTDVGWFFNHNWAAELSTNVKFNKLDENLIWDTLLTLGARYRIEEHYFRGYLGAGVLVIVLDKDAPVASNNNNTRRIHLDGPALGFGFGKTKTTKNKLVWFIELNTTAQMFTHRDEVAIDGQYPIAVSSQAVTDNSTIIGAQITIGVLLF